jgi:dihydrofolate reductase
MRKRCARAAEKLAQVSNSLVGRGETRSNEEILSTNDRATRVRTVSRFKLDIVVSLDGYVAGPNQGVDNPLGEGGDRLHAWVYPLEAFHRMHGDDQAGEVNASTPFVERMFENVGAVVMGRNMFGGGSGPWGDDPWDGWWGDDPPYHMPVFVVTHHEREPLEKQGGTTFFFVTDGIEAALDRGREASGDKDVLIGGGASVAQQYIAAGLLDEIQLHIVPVLLGAGARLFDNLGSNPTEFEQHEAIEAPGVTHIKYRRISD